MGSAQSQRTRTPAVRNAHRYLHIRTHICTHAPHATRARTHARNARTREVSVLQVVGAPLPLLPPAVCGVHSAPGTMEGCETASVRDSKLMLNTALEEHFTQRLASRTPPPRFWRSRSAAMGTVQYHARALFLVPCVDAPVFCLLKAMKGSARYVGELYRKPPAHAGDPHNGPATMPRCPLVGL